MTITLITCPKIKIEETEINAEEEKKRSEAVAKARQDTDTKAKTKILLTKIGQQEAIILGSIKNLNRIIELTEPKDKLSAAVIMDDQLLDLEIQVKHLSELINEIMPIIADDNKVIQINETYGKIIQEHATKLKLTVACLVSSTKEAKM